MEQTDITYLLDHKLFPEPCQSVSLIETHISWVLLTDDFVYKIKKPVCFEFLDFRSLAQRSYYCSREIMLNQRLTEGVYLEKLPVKRDQGKISIGEGSGTTIDYAIKMRRIPQTLEMGRMLREGTVTEAHIHSIAKVLAAFHQRNSPLSILQPLESLRAAFNDIAKLPPEAQQVIPVAYRSLIPCMIQRSDQFLDEHQALIDSRCRRGYVRDCHGDLHSRNIFLTDPPTLFDCIEFNDSLRHIDILNEVAFLCMDLDVHGRQDLGRLFLETYHSFLPLITSPREYALFRWYKMYRANVRAKIYLLRFMQEPGQKAYLVSAIEFLVLIHAYLQTLSSAIPPLFARS